MNPDYSNSNNIATNCLKTKIPGKLCKSDKELHAMQAWFRLNIQTGNTISACLANFATYCEIQDEITSRQKS